MTSPLSSVNERLFSAWEAYVARGESDPMMRPVVRESWKRCAGYGLAPRVLPPQEPDAERLRWLRERSRELVSAGERHLERVHRTLGRLPHLLVLADTEGNILSLLADPVAEELGVGSNLFAGASWHERDIGCNGIGTALAAGEPVILIGPEHYIEPYGAWTCLGIPIRGQHREIAGALDLSVPNESVDPMTWGWMLDVADDVESSLCEAQSQRPGEEAPDALKGPLQAVRGVLEFLGREGGLSRYHEPFIREAVAEAQAAERRLRQVTEREEFAGIVAHELRGPLTVILGQAHSLERRLGMDDQDLVACVKDLRLAAERLDQTVQNMLLLAQASDTGGLEPVALGPLLGEALRETALADRVVVELPAELPPVLGRATWIRSVFLNLLSNAAKYSPPDAEIRIEVACRSDVVVTRVLDRGVGIPVQAMDAIFTSFYRSEETQKMAEGHGLGLALCRRVITEMGGEIRASPRPGGGSEFAFSLPRA